jgi:hypothetical protein
MAGLAAVAATQTLFTTNYPDLTLCEALSGIFGSISLAAWIFVLVSLTEKPQREDFELVMTLYKLIGSATGRKLQTRQRGRRVTDISDDMVYW